MKYIIIGISILAFCIFLYYYKLPETKNELYFDYDWSNTWSVYDRKARVEADCKPIHKIHMKLGSVSSWIWTVPNSCEQGLPHTRGSDVIAIPLNYPKERLPPLLDHERVHLLQRMMPDSWAKFYRIKWRYTIYNSAPFGMPEKMIQLKRGNPDTSDAPYACWRSRWWSVPTYISDSNLSLKNAVIKWWDQETGTISESAPDEWVVFFGTHIHQCEHPHELSAEYLSGPLRNGQRPTVMPEGMRLLAEAWSKDSMFPQINE